MEIVIYLLTGAIAGLLAGLLGIGGGLVIVPALALFFASQGFADATLMHFAVGTSLATIIPISVSSLLAHHRRDSVDWQAVRGLVPGIIPGALAGAWLARQVSSPGLAILFGVFEVLVAVHLLIGRQAGANRALAGASGLGVAGAVIGGVSSMLGIGGGTLSVPFLLWSRVDIRTAVGTAATCGLPIAIAGAVGFAISGWNVTAQAGLSSGFIYWPAVFWLALASVPIAPLGARLAHYLPRKILQRVFALILAMIGLKMILGV